MNQTEQSVLTKEQGQKYAYEDCSFQEGQPVEIRGRKARVRWMEVNGLSKTAKPKMTGSSSFLKKGKQEIEFVAPRYTYDHPWHTRQYVKNENGEKILKIGQKENEFGLKEAVVFCSIPHAFIRVGDKLGSIDLRDIEVKIVERENWGNDASLM